MIDKIFKSDNEWRQILTPEQFDIMRKGGTELPFSCTWGPHNNGVYNCAACDLPLFKSAAKFESGSGWPSYFEPISDDNIIKEVDSSHGMTRTEVLCYRCESHLGHVFPDGPPPTYERYCINSIALNFKPNERKNGS